MSGNSSEPGIADLIRDVNTVVRDGLEDSFDRLVALRSIQWYAEAVTQDSATEGVPALRETLKEALASWDRDTDDSPRRKAMDALFAWNRRGKHARALNGTNGLRAQAGQAFDVGPDRFHRKWEEQVVSEFADHLLAWGGRPRPRAAAPLLLTWDEVEAVAHRLHRDIDRDIRPDVMVTMAGPGSVAACYCMKVSALDTPVLMAVTFPRRAKRTTAETQFDRAATSARWKVVRTDKWVIYLPSALLEYFPGARILLLDDRVITGTAQRAVQELLEAEEGKQFDVRRGALFAPSAMRGDLDFIGRIIDGEFEMPWGSSRGRT